MNSSSHTLQGPELVRFLNLNHSVDLDPLFASTLTGPLEEFLSRPRKNIREQIVRLGFSLVSGGDALDEKQKAEVLHSSCAILEVLHAGSLIIDDIEDQSRFRRGAQALHEIHGLPLALNAGNSLYFLPSKMIADLPVDATVRFSLLHHCNETLLRAHYGQALDLGVSIRTLDQAQVYETNLAIMELKSGVLIGLALKMGAIACAEPAATIEGLDKLGRKLGVALQMFDDIGSLTSSHNVEKKCEDLKMKRLSFVIATAARVMPRAAYEQLLRLIDDCDAHLEEILKLLSQHAVTQTAQAEAKAYLEGVRLEAINAFQFQSRELEIFNSIQNVLVKSYG